jgi:hypothetical protein
MTGSDSLGARQSANSRNSSITLNFLHTGHWDGLRGTEELRRTASPLNSETSILARLLGNAARVSMRSRAMSNGALVRLYDLDSSILAARRPHDYRRLVHDLNPIGETRREGNPINFVGDRIA